VIEGETVMKSFLQLFVTSEFHFPNAVLWIGKEEAEMNCKLFTTGEQTVVLLYNTFLGLA